MKNLNRINRILAGFAVASGLSLVAAMPSSAQDGRIGLEASAGYYMLGGDDFDPFDNALGFEALGSYAFDSGLELGVGTGITSHDLDGTIANSGDVVSVFADGRYRFAYPASSAPHLHPFVAARVGWSRMSLDVEDEGDDPSASGLLVGGGGGVEYWFTDAVAVTGAGMFDLLDYGNSDELADFSGNRVVLKGGLKVRF